MLVNLLQRLHDLSISGWVRESFNIFPALESIHIYSMIFLITMVAAFDLRLLGYNVARHPQPLSKFSRVVIPWAWLCLGVNFVTGTLLFISKAPDYYTNPAFRIKMLLILIGVVYHSLLLPVAVRWDDVPAMSFSMKFAGGVSLLLWIGVITASRMIAFT
jgi:hypothetical protein